MSDKPKVMTRKGLVDVIYAHTDMQMNRCEHLADALMGLCVETRRCETQIGTETPDETELRGWAGYYPSQHAYAGPRRLLLIIAPDAEPERDAPSDEYRRDAETCASIVYGLFGDEADKDTVYAASRRILKAKGE